MANPLKSLTPLGHATAQSDTIGAVTITENTGTALASLASRLGREAEVAARGSSRRHPAARPRSQPYRRDLCRDLAWARTMDDRGALRHAMKTSPRS